MNMPTPGVRIGSALRVFVAASTVIALAFIAGSFSYYGSEGRGAPAGQFVAISALAAFLIALAALAIAYTSRKREAAGFQKHHESEHQLRESRETFRTALYGIGDAVTTADRAGRVRQMNPAAERLTGWTEAQASGRPLEDVLRIVDEATREPLENPGASVVRSGQLTRLTSTTLLIARDGTLRPIAGYTAPVRDENGAVIGVVLVFSDQREEQWAQQDLSEREERLRLALTAANQGLFDLNVQTGDAVVSPEYATMLGFDPTEFRETNALWIERMHPYDRPSVVNAYQDYVAGRRSDYRVEFRQRTKSGEWKWILSLGSVVARSADGQPLRMLGTHTDITERKRVETENAEWRNRYEAAISATGQILYDWDLRTNTITYGGAVQRILGIAVEELKDDLSYWVSLIYPDDVSAFEAEVERVVKSATLFKQQYRLRRKDGSYASVADEGHVLVDSAGQVVRMVGFVTDISERKLTEQALIDSEAQYRRIVDTSLEGIWTIDAESRTTFVNQRMAEMLGYRVEEMLGRSLFDFMDEDALAFAETNVQRRRAGIAEHHLFKLRHKTGADVWTEMSTGPMRDQHQRYQGALAMVTDVTERRQLEEQLRATREHFQALVERSHDLTLIVDRAGTIQYVNPASKSVLGFDPEEMIGRSSLSFVHPEDVEGARTEFERQLSDPGSVLQIELRVQDKRGGWRSLDAIGTNLVHVPSLAGIVINCRDITERVQSEEVIRESERRLATVLANLPGYVYRVANDAQYTPEYISEAVSQVTGYKQHEYLVDRTISCGAEIYPEDHETVWRIVQKAIAAHQPYECEYRILTKSGDQKWVWERGRGTFGPSGELMFLEGFVTDITERKRAETALRQSEENLAITLRSIGDAVIATDPEGRIARMNDTAERMTGWPLAEAMSQPLSEVFKIVDAQTRVPAVDPVQQVLTRGEIIGLAHHTTMIGRDGTEYQIADSAAPIRDASGGIIGAVLVFSDITEQYRVQQALRDQEQRLRTIIETEPECVKVVGPDGRLLEMNAAGLAMLEVNSLEEAKRCPLSEFIVPEHRSAFFALHERVMGGEVGTVSFEVIGFRGTRRWLETHAAPMRDANGKVTTLLGVTRDITERKRAEGEKERLEAQLRQSQKMEAVGQLAGGVAHDFNNLLTVINGRVELILDDLPKYHPLHSDLQEIRRAGERAAALTKQLLSFSRKQILAPEVLDLNTVLASMQQLLSRLIREDVELVVLPSSGLGMIKADRGQVEQVIMNLAINARDAMPSGGTLTIATRNVDLDDAFAAGHPATTPGAHVMLAVSDTGIGMDPDTRTRIFEPFFTTKGLGQGTGLGLSTVYGIVTQSGGMIDVQSELGTGTTFKVYLPQIALESPKGPCSRVMKQHRGAETVLVVDDEAALVRVATRMLESAGYRVLSAPNGVEALRLLEHQGMTR